MARAGLVALQAAQGISRPLRLLQALAGLNSPRWGTCRPLPLSHLLSPLVLVPIFSPIQVSTLEFFIGIETFQNLA